MTKLNAHYDVVVLGAGMIGAAFALSLAKNTKLSIALLEQSCVTQSKPLATQKNQKVVALGKLATQLLDELQILQKLNTDACYPYTAMTVWDESSNGVLEFSAADHDQDVLGYMVDGNELTMQLQQAALDHTNIEVIDSISAESLSLSAESATVSSKDSSITASLIVAADGAQSWARRQAKIFAQRYSYKQKGIVATIRTADSHRDTAWQVFLKTGPLAILPLHENQSSIVWSAETDIADNLMASAKSEFCDELAAALQYRLGEVELLSDRQSFELMSIRADRYYQQRLVLIGDAAHCIHPLAGQGANLGFKDVISLIKILKNQDQNNLGDLNILHQYQIARKSDNETTDQFMSLLHETYKANSPLWKSARGLGMNLMSSSNLIKSVFVKQAMGI